MNLTKGKTRCALLTIGAGPVPASTYSALKCLVDLKCVVLSKRLTRKPVLAAVREFGLWYTVQSMISMLVNRVGDHSITEEILKRDDIHYVEWSEKDDESRVISLLQELDIEFVLVCGFHHILHSQLINCVKHCFNMHPSLLPAFKGPEPISWGLLCREQDFGITVHEVDEEIDHGDILGQASITAPILPLRALVELKLSGLVQGLLKEIVKDMRAGQLRPRKQGEGTYLPVPSIENRRLYREGYFDSKEQDHQT